MVESKATAASIPPPPSLRKLTDINLSVERKYVKLGYRYLTSHTVYAAFLITATIIIASQLLAFSLQDVSLLWGYLHSNLRLPMILLFTLLLSFTPIGFRPIGPPPVYLVNFSCYKPRRSLKSSRHHFMEVARKSGSFSEDGLSFQRKILERSGFGDSTYASGTFHKYPLDFTVEAAREESELMMFGAIDELLTKACIKTSDIDILIVNCTVFNPVPSLSAMIVNRYKLRGNILSYNLAGMGCSAGIVAVDLAKDLLRVHRNSYALVVSTENITLNWYSGNDRSMLITNCLFRMGASAVLLSNRPSDSKRSKYQLLHAVGTHKGADDKCFASITQREDSTGNIGVSLSKDLVAVAGEALKTNITTLGPLVLPVSEQLLFFATLMARKLFGVRIKPYVPDFSLAFEHVCVHVGGKAVLDEVEKNLQLTEWHMEPSRMTLYRFGNISSSSIWYELAYSEAKGRMNKGDKVWQIAFGSGFKCYSSVWTALATVDPTKENNTWMDEIQQFPVGIPSVAPF